MYPSQHLLPLSLAVSLAQFPSSVLARGSGSIDLGGSSSRLSLEPFNAAIFAFFVIFGVLTANQTIHAAFNIITRNRGNPAPNTLPESNVGYIFPIFLLLSTLLATIHYVLRAFFWGREYNLNNIIPPSFDVAYINAWNTLGFLYEVFLVTGLLVLVSHREKVLFNSCGKLFIFKRIVDSTFPGALIALGASYAGILGNLETTEDVIRSGMILEAFYSLFLVVAVDVALSSLFLHIRAKRIGKNDKISFCLTFVISPALIIYAVYTIIAEQLLTTRIWTKMQVDQWNVAGTAISSILKFVVYAACLVLGKPVVHKEVAQTQAAQPDAHFDPYKSYGA